MKMKEIGPRGRASQDPLWSTDVMWDFKQRFELQSKFLKNGICVFSDSANITQGYYGTVQQWILIFIFPERENHEK